MIQTLSSVPSFRYAPLFAALLACCARVPDEPLTTHPARVELVPAGGRYFSTGCVGIRTLREDLQVLATARDHAIVRGTLRTRAPEPGEWSMGPTGRSRTYVTSRWTLNVDAVLLDTSDGAAGATVGRDLEVHVLLPASVQMRDVAGAVASPFPGERASEPVIADSATTAGPIFVLAQADGRWRVMRSFMQDGNMVMASGDRVDLDGVLREARRVRGTE